MRSANDPVKNKPKSKGQSGKEGTSGRNDRAVGEALREAYDEAVGEGIPEDMLDLLKKLD